MSDPAAVARGGSRTLTAGLVAVVSLVAFEAMAVATAMPVAVAELDGIPAYGWAFSAFLVTFLFSTVVAGSFSDAGGPRLPLLGGVAVFGAGLLVAGLAPTMPVFVVGRALQGLGAGGIIVAVYVVVGRAFDDSRRPQVFAWLSAAWVVPAIVGPLVAGFLADHLSWRWIFLGVLVLAVPLVLVIVPQLSRVPERVAAPSTPRQGAKRAALGTAVAVALLQYAGTRLDALGLVLAVAAVALLVPTVPRLLPPGTLRLARGLPTTVLMRGIMAAAFFGAETFLPLALVNERGLSTTMAGLALTGGAVGWATGSFVQGHPARERPRWQLVQTGCCFVAAAIVVAALAVTTTLPAALAGFGWVLGGLGMGLGMASVSVVSLELAPVADHGFTSAALQVCDGLCSTVAIVVGSTIFAAGHAAPGQDAEVFAAIFALMAAVAVFGAVVAPRMRPLAERRTDPAPARPRTGHDPERVAPPGSEPR